MTGHLDKLRARYRRADARGYMFLAKLFAKWSRNAYRLAVAIDPDVQR